MGRTISLYLGRQLLLVTVFAAVGLCSPVIYISLQNHLGDRALHTELAWIALQGVGPMITFMTLPACTGVAMTWCYGHFRSEGTLTVLQAAGYSGMAAFAPALITATLMSGMCFYLACFVAPEGARVLQNVLFNVSVNPDVSLLEPRRFNTSRDGRQVLYFGSQPNANLLRDVFLWENLETTGERMFTAPQASVLTDEQGTLLVLTAGSGFLTDDRNPQGRAVSFNRMEVPLQFGSPKTRNWTAPFELSTYRFLQEIPRLQTTERVMEWTSEGIKRFVFPSLAIGYTLLGAALLNFNRAIVSPIETIAVCLCILLLHILVVVTVELASHDIFMLGSAIALVMLVFASPLLLALQSDASFGRPFEAIFSRIGAG